MGADKWPMKPDRQNMIGCQKRWPLLKSRVRQPVENEWKTRIHYLLIKIQALEHTHMNIHICVCVCVLSLRQLPHQQTRVSWHPWIAVKLLLGDLFFQSPIAQKGNHYFVFHVHVTKINLGGENADEKIQRLFPASFKSSHWHGLFNLLYWVFSYHSSPDREADRLQVRLSLVVCLPFTLINVKLRVLIQRLRRVCSLRKQSMLWKWAFRPEFNQQRSSSLLSSTSGTDEEDVRRQTSLSAEEPGGDGPLRIPPRRQPGCTKLVPIHQSAAEALR